MKTCLIYGQNGLDLDVTLNLRSFYKKLGLKVFFSDKLHPADLLVVVRAVDKEINIEPFNYSLVHVYDYGGWDYDAFVQTIDHSKTFIFCTSEAKKERLIEKLNFPKKQVYIALPPVDTSLWSKAIKKIKYDFVHIGNFKPIVDEDIFKLRFNKAISYFRSNLWGLGWKSNEEVYHGKAGLFEVSKIYAQSKFSFGLMYPFQREVTFSGRFWQAPLNGCFLFSEPGLYSQKIPGVIETDYTIKDINNKLNQMTSSLELQQKAKQFWENQSNITLSYVKPTFKLLEKNNFKIVKYLSFIKLSVINILKVYYQKLLLFKLKD